MRKGQISFDLMLAMVVAIIFVGSIALVAGVIGDNARLDSIRSQEQQIGNELASVLNSATVLTGGDSFSVTYDVPKIRTANGIVPCIITLNSNDITIVVTDSEIGDITSKIPFVRPSLSPDSLVCGQQMVIPL